MEADAPLQAASTVVLLRDGADGVEVLLVKRHAASPVLGNMFVFPGGKVDERDLDPCDVEPEAELLARLGEPTLPIRSATGLFLAALRELHEECGVLLPEHRALWPWSRWITPVMQPQPRRFDTRFFVARMPPDAVATHDGHEVTQTCWIRPRDALARQRSGALAIAPPQLMTLLGLAPHGDVDQVIAQARSRRPFRIEPRVHVDQGGVFLCYPGDPAHPDPVRAMPGPLRFEMRDGRYAPVGPL